MVKKYAQRYWVFSGMHPDMHCMSMLPAEPGACCVHAVVQPAVHASVHACSVVFTVFTQSSLQGLHKWGAYFWVKTENKGGNFVMELFLLILKNK